MRSGRAPSRPKRPRSKKTRAKGKDEVDRHSDRRVDAQRLEPRDLDVGDAVRQLPGRRRYGEWLTRASDESDRRDEPMTSCGEQGTERQCHGRPGVPCNTARVASDGHDGRDRGQRRARSPQRDQRKPQRPVNDNAHSTTSLCAARATASHDDQPHRADRAGPAVSVANGERTLRPLDGTASRASTRVGLSSGRAGRAVSSLVAFTKSVRRWAHS